MQIVSDLHLEFYRNPLDLKLKVTSPYLALLGDICVAGTNDIKNLEKFLDYYSPKYKLIFWLPGNHEYYTSKKNPLTIDEITIRMKTLCKKYGNVIFLNNKHYDLELNGAKYRIIGTTLWAYIPETKEKYALEYLNDYYHIYTSGEGSNGLITYEKARKIKPTDVNILHAKSVKYIDRHLRESPLPLIIFTHHKPFLGIDEKNGPLGPLPSINTRHRDPTGYETDQVSGLNEQQKKKIAIWCYGHTHKHFNGKVHGVWFLSNPKGYPNQQTKFENGLSINIPN
jgi:predicted phosphodiesterase